jgi:hypothetical protein
MTLYSETGIIFQVTTAVMINCLKNPKENLFEIISYLILEEFGTVTIRIMKFIIKKDVKTKNVSRNTWGDKYKLYVKRGYSGWFVRFPLSVLKA